MASVAGFGSEMSVEFERAWNMEIQALMHRQKVELTEFKAKMPLDLKNYERQLKDEKEMFLTLERSGLEKTEFEEVQRLKLIEYKNDQIEEEARLSKNHEKAIAKLRDKIKSKLTQFESIEKKGKTPPEFMWPSGFKKSADKTESKEKEQEGLELR